MVKPDSFYLHPEVLSTYRVRDLKRILQRRYRYLQADIDKFLLKEEYIKAIIDNEKKLSATAEGPKAEIFSESIMWILVAVAFVVMASIQLRNNVFFHGAASFRDPLLFASSAAIMALSLVTLWMNATVAAGWILPWFLSSRQYSLVAAYMFPMPPVGVDLNTVIGSGAAGAGGAGPSINVFPIIMSYFISNIRHKVERYYAERLSLLTENRRSDCSKKRRGRRKVYEDDYCYDE